MGSEQERPSNALSSANITVNVDTAQLDEAIAKARTLHQLLERIDALAYRSSKLLERMVLDGNGTGIPVGLMASIKGASPHPQD